MPGLIKVGFSMKDPDIRAVELNHTGSPHPYIVDYEVLVEEPRNVEQTVHGRLRGQREGKEWFRCSTEEAIASIKSVVGSKAQIENFKRADRTKAEAIRKQKEAEERAITQQTEAKERMKRVAEEELKRSKDAYNSRRQEIIDRCESSLKTFISSQELPFLYYFVAICFVLSIAISELFPKINDAGLIMLAILSAFIVTPFVKDYFKEKIKQSDDYKLCLTRRDDELQLLEFNINSISSATHLAGAVKSVSERTNGRPEQLSPSSSSKRNELIIIKADDSQVTVICPICHSSKDIELDKPYLCKNCNKWYSIPDLIKVHHKQYNPSSRPRKTPLSLSTASDRDVTYKYPDAVSNQLSVEKHDESLVLEYCPFCHKINQAKLGDAFFCKNCKKRYSA